MTCHMELLEWIWNSFISNIAKPHWEHLISLVIILRWLDQFSEAIDSLFNSSTDENVIFSKVTQRPPKLSLYILFITCVWISITPVLLINRDLPCDVLLIGTALFLFLSDAEVFLSRVKYVICSIYHRATLNSLWASVCNSILQKSPKTDEVYSKLFGFTTEQLINLLLKLCILGVGATSGHAYLESLCIVALLQNIVYVLTLLLGIPSFIFLLKVSYLTKVSRKTESRICSPGPLGYTQRIGRRVRSISCSIDESAYPERRHVDVRQLVKQLEALHAETPTQERIKYITIVGLLVLYLHNRYILWNSKSQDYCELNPVGSSQTEDDRETNDTSGSSHWINSAMLDHTNFNLFFFLLIGILLYYRAKVYAFQRTKLLNLDLKPYVENTWEPVKNSDTDNDTVVKYDDCISSRSDSFAFTKIPKERSHSSIESPTHALYSGNNTHNSRPTTSTIVEQPLLPLGTGEHRAKQATTMKLSASDSELLQLLSTGELKTRELESVVGNPVRAVELRRLDLARLLSSPHVLERLPYKEYDYRYVHGQCCEEVIGYLPIPVGKVGPLLLDGHSHYVPLATTEGCLVASTNRGCRALFLAGGVKSVLFRDQMTRAPVVWFASIREVVECIAWIESAEGFAILKNAFEQTSAHIQLLSVFPNPCGHYLHIRFAARTGEAMGMNMVSKAANAALRELHCHFPAMQVISLSGNMCTDKKPATINSILGRGKSVIAEARLPATVLAQVLHTTAVRLVRLAHAKNWTGSAMAGCSGMMGSNAHAANIVAGIFAATGQDLAQVVDASACLTQFEVGDNDSLVATVTMPCLEVGTIGGGTRLPAQRSCLDLLDLSVDRPTEHLARIVAGTVLAGELSLMAALDTDDLVTAHLRLNRAIVKTGCSAAIKTSASDSVSGGSGSSAWVNGSVPLSVKSDASNPIESSHPTM